MLVLIMCVVGSLIARPALAQDADDPARIAPRPGRVALTFDDGPDPEWTPVVLDILDEYGVKATFFVIGVRVAEYPEIAAEVLRRGHSLQNHGYRHHLITTLSDWEVRREIVRSRETIMRATGHTPTCFRPAYGQFDERTIAIADEVGETLVLWSVDSADYYYLAAPGTIQSVLADLHAGDVILMHDTLGWVARDALPVIIEAVRAAGLGFDTLCDGRRWLELSGPVCLRWGRFHPTVE